LFNFFFGLSGLGFVVGAGMTWIFGNWHWGLRFTPVLGIVAVILLLIIEDPPRGESEGAHLSTTSWWTDIKYLFTKSIFKKYSFSVQKTFLFITMIKTSFISVKHSFTRL